MAHKDDLWCEINVRFNAYSLDGSKMLEQHSHYID